MTLDEIMEQRAEIILKGIGFRYPCYVGEYALNNRQLNTYHEGANKLVFKYDNGAGIAFDDITLADILSLETDPKKEVPQLEGEGTEVDVQEFDNRGSSVPLPYTYVTTFEETHTNSEEFKAGFELEIATHAGPEYISVDLTAKASTEYDRSNEESRTANRSLSRSGEVPPGEFYRVTGTREKRKYTQDVRAIASIKHKVHIWSAQDVSATLGFGGHRGFDCYWNDISDIIRIMKGQGHYGDDHFTQEFKDRPETAENIAILEATGVPLSYQINFPDVEVNRITVDKVEEDE